MCIQHATESDGRRVGESAATMFFAVFVDEAQQAAVEATCLNHTSQHLGEVFHTCFKRRL